MIFKKYFIDIKKFNGLVKLMRVHHPIGFFLLIWPSLWGLWIAHQGVPNFYFIIYFILGAVCMRSAGCIINDYIDRDIDIYIRRTKDRPFPSGKVTKNAALIMFLILIFISAILVCRFNFITILLSLSALILSIIYPYLKRYIYFPQLILGILFSYPILMAFTATNNSINSTMWLLCIINIIWTIVYDTEYAMADCDDDRDIGLKSSAILFGDMDKFIIGILQLIIVCMLSIIGWKDKLSIIFYGFALFGVVSLFIWQQILICKRKREKCLEAFLNNNYVGMCIFLGFALSLY